MDYVNVTIDLPGQHPSASWSTHSPQKKQLSWAALQISSKPEQSGWSWPVQYSSVLCCTGQRYLALLLAQRMVLTCVAVPDTNICCILNQSNLYVLFFLLFLRALYNVSVLLINW